MLIFLSMALLTDRASAGIYSCFSDSKMPKVFKSEFTTGESKYYTITGNTNTIYLGGRSNDGDLTSAAYTDAAIITRIELYTPHFTSSVAWQMYYKDINSQLENISGMALNPDGSKLAVYVFSQRSGLDFWKGS